MERSGPAVKRLMQIANDSLDTGLAVAAAHGVTPVQTVHWNPEELIVEYRPSVCAATFQGTKAWRGRHYARQQRLYLRPLPQGQGSLRPTGRPRGTGGMASGAFQPTAMSPR